MEGVKKLRYGVNIYTTDNKFYEDTFKTALECFDFCKLQVADLSEIKRVVIFRRP